MKTTLLIFVLLLGMSVQSQNITIPYLDEGELTLLEGEEEHDYFIEDHQKIDAGKKIVYGKDMYELREMYKIKHFQTHEIFYLRLFLNKHDNGKWIIKKVKEPKT